MSLVFEEWIAAHENIYLKRMGKSDCERNLFVRYALPSSGINENTGILNLIPGYSANINSKVFKKMIDTFPDKYNIIVIQCDYFGNKYMGGEPSEFCKFLMMNTDINKIDIEFRRFEKEEQESETEFNDSGIMQALDIVYATLHVLKLIYNKNQVINTKKIMLFGSSHGGYLAHLANVICPSLFSYIFDISAYIYPFYLKNERVINYTSQNKKICESFDIYIKEHKELQYMNELYSLEYLYSHFENKCKIISFNGTDDDMVSIEQKNRFIYNIDYAEIVAISSDLVDNYVFNSSMHGVGLNFIRFFDIIMPELCDIECSTEACIEEEVNIGDNLVINYRSGFPIVKHINWGE